MSEAARLPTPKAAPESTTQPEKQSSNPPPPPRHQSIFAVPEPIRRLFNRFPLHTSPENDLPERCIVETTKDMPVLFVFANDEGARAGAPSYNPACLKWQIYLKIAGIPFLLRPSNNHASPSGALPFLLTSESAIPTSKLNPYIAAHGTPSPTPSNSQTYCSMLDTLVRPAYLHALYLAPANARLLSSLYVPASTPLPVRAAILHTLRSAAEEEVLATTGLPALAPERIYADAEAAFTALEVALLASSRTIQEGDGGRWLFGEPEPTMFDAEVFAYTSVLLDEGLEWGDARLGDLVRRHPSLVEHRDALLRRYWPEFGREGE